MIMSMKALRFLMFFSLLISLAGCADLRNKFVSSQPAKVERVGMLMQLQCTQTQECSKYQLLSSGMRDTTAHLNGNISDHYAGQLIAVLGTAKTDRGGTANIHVEKVRPITQFNSQLFLAQAVASYTEQHFDCATLWDQQYDWRLDGRQPILIARLIHPKSPRTAILLEYDGLSKALLSVSSEPEIVNPCLLN